MGQRFSQQKTYSELLGHYPPLDQYNVKYSGQDFYIWQSLYGHGELIEYPLTTSDQSLLNDQIKIYFFRHRHDFLFSSLYFLIKGKEQIKNVGQSLNEKQFIHNKISIFYERTLTNLSRIKDLPFWDTLKFYYVALKGFQILYHKYGYFDITESMFFLTHHKKLKVWCNSKVEKAYPIQNSNILSNYNENYQQLMIKKIVRIIFENTDCFDPNFSEAKKISSLLQNQSGNFVSAISTLRDICRQKQWVIPEKLQCFDAIKQWKVQGLLDEFVTKELKRQEKVQKLHNSKTYTAVNYPLHRVRSTSKQKIRGKGISISHKSPVHLAQNCPIYQPFNDSLSRVPSNQKYFQTFNPSHFKQNSHQRNKILETQISFSPAPKKYMIHNKSSPIIERLPQIISSPPKNVTPLSPSISSPKLAPYFKFIPQQTISHTPVFYPNNYKPSHVPYKNTPKSRLPPLPYYQSSPKKIIQNKFTFSIPRSHFTKQYEQTKRKNWSLQNQKGPGKTARSGSLQMSRNATKQSIVIFNYKNNNLPKPVINNHFQTAQYLNNTISIEQTQSKSKTIIQLQKNDTNFLQRIIINNDSKREQKQNMGQQIKQIQPITLNVQHGSHSKQKFEEISKQQSKFTSYININKRDQQQSPFRYKFMTLDVNKYGRDKPKIDSFQINKNYKESKEVYKFSDIVKLDFNNEINSHINSQKKQAQPEAIINQNKKQPKYQPGIDPEIWNDVIELQSKRSNQ